MDDNNSQQTFPNNDLNQTVTHLRRPIPWRRLLLAVFGFLLLALLTTFLLITHQKAIELITQPVGQHKLPQKSPADFGLHYKDVTVTSSDGFNLVGWYIPGTNGALILAQHGYKASRGEMLTRAAMLHHHGYGVLITSVRAHDGSDGERISFGHEEMKDLDAWYHYATHLPEVDIHRIGIVGASMGGSLVIQYAAQNPGIHAVIADSAFASLDDVVSTAVTFYTGLPRFPFAPAIERWAEWEGGFSAGEINARRWVHAISPRPIMILQGGTDQVIPTDSGQKLYQAAGSPKELWYEPTLGHTEIHKKEPKEYERRMAHFFDQYLPPEKPQTIRASLVPTGSAVPALP
ncbi:MAG TPA: alpha/beta hydrolase [Rhodocyclaceae bacterium]|nr:alpha/beta hydrolase [Rhodocyclaceae bacterium]